MINYMKRTDIISDIHRGVPDSRIARERECSRNTVGGREEGRRGEEGLEIAFLKHRASVLGAGAARPLDCAHKRLTDVKNLACYTRQIQ